MAIERFEDWGAPATDGDDCETFSSDAELASAALAAHQNGRCLRAGLVTGDVLATAGLEAPRPSGERYELPLDLILASPTDDPQRPAESVEPFVAHAVAGRPLSPWWSCVAMNTPWRGAWRLGPRAHPNDGLIDVTSGSIPWGQVLEARRRVKTGAHLPHPGLEHKRVAEMSIRFPRPLTVALDGVERGRWAGMHLAVVPDAILLVA